MTERKASQWLLVRMQRFYADVQPAWEEFVGLVCYGENCIGAVVRNVREAVELRKELEATIGTIVKPDTANHNPPTTWLLSYDLRCLSPPETTPFTVPAKLLCLSPAITAPETQFSC